MKIAQRFGAFSVLAVTVVAVAAVAIAGSVSGATSGSTATTSSTKPPPKKPTVVLVHGAWADSSGWSGVTETLQAQGYTVLAPPNPLRDLQTDSEYLSAFLKARTEGPVILVGHSYGGAVITNAARSDKDVKALVFVNAFAPANGESVLQILDPNHELDPTTLFDFVPQPDKNPKTVDFYLKQDVFPGAFANGVDPAQAAVMATAQRGITQRALEGQSGSPAWKQLPTFYVVGTDDHIIPADLQRSMAERAGSTVVEVAAGHLSMITQPQAVADVIVRAAKPTR